MDVYNVQIMKRYQAAGARQHFSEVLDAAQRGEQVIIERRGVRFRLEPVRQETKPAAREPLFRIVDPAVEAGTWTWNFGKRGLRFSARRKRR
jgi:prevent-host-death family protein